MMLRGMILGEVIGFVEITSSPENMELALAYTVTDPVEAHVDGFGAFLLHGVGCDSGGSAVISL